MILVVPIISIVERGKILETPRNSPPHPSASLESTVNQELCKLFDWLTANKLTLNIKKTNFVIFRPAQRKLTYHPKIMIFDNDQNKNVALECKEFVRYLGIIIDNNLSWKHHIDHVAIKMSRTVGLICKLRHFLPRHTLLTIFCSLFNLWFDGPGPRI